MIERSFFDQNVQLDKPVLLLTLSSSSQPFEVLGLDL